MYQRRRPGVGGPVLTKLPSTGRSRALLRGGAVARACVLPSPGLSSPLNSTSTDPGVSRALE